MKIKFLLTLCLLSLIGFKCEAQPITRVCVQTNNTSSGVSVYSCPDIAPGNPFPVITTPSGLASEGITSVVSASSGNNLILKAAPGNLYSAYASNNTATAGFLIIVNSITVPSDGAVAPLECAALPANGNASINYNPGPPSVFSTGIVVIVSSGADCFTKTTGTLTAFIKGSVK